MSDNKRSRIPSGLQSLDVPLAASVVATGLTGRFERPNLARAVPRPATSRHSAITRNLQNYANYKTWAEKIKSNWEPSKAPKR
jgi:hypothetical protein